MKEVIEEAAEEWNKPAGPVALPLSPEECRVTEVLRLLQGVGL